MYKIKSLYDNKMDFTGEYRLRFRAIPNGVNQKMSGDVLKYPEFPYKIGDRVAQMWVEPILKVKFIERELTNITDRIGGFGSTNKK